MVTGLYSSCREPQLCHDMVLLHENQQLTGRGSLLSDWSGKSSEEYIALKTSLAFMMVVYDPEVQL